MPSCNKSVNKSSNDIVKQRMTLLYSSLRSHYAGLTLLYAFASGEKKLKNHEAASPPNLHRLEWTVTNIKNQIIAIEHELQFLTTIHN